MMKDRYYKVSGHSGLVKNPRTGTVLNTNGREIDAARKRKKKKKELEQEVVDLKSQVERLSSIIEQLAEK